MLSRLFAFVALLWAATSLPAREFTVLVYNVENLFDVDGVAVFDDYRQDDPENPYTPARFLTKLRHIGETLAAVNDGDGPEVVLFQEFELDRTPFSDWRSPEAFLEAFADTTAEALLTSDFSARIAGLPAEAFLLKHLSDLGVGPYQVARPDTWRLERAPAHQNVIFSKFPIKWVRQRALSSARDLLIAGLDVDGHELVVFNNHWKAGASNPRTEPTRVQNAHVVRAELEAILLENPVADVLIAGDLNSYYNQAAVFPELEETGVNDVLGSSTDELALVEGRGRGLYNLWGELRPEERGSEIYRGYWGTLMQILLTRGLYDEVGVQYIDNSFFRLILPGRNVETTFGTPRRWVPFGDGSGFSDHLPIGARFRTTDQGDAGTFRPLERPTRETRLTAHLPAIDYTLPDRESLSAAGVLKGLSESALAQRMGEHFVLDARFVGETRDRVRVAGREFGLYAPAPETREAVDALSLEGAVRVIGRLDAYRGEAQFVLEHPSWVGD